MLSLKELRAKDRRWWWQTFVLSDLWHFLSMLPCLVLATVFAFLIGDTLSTGPNMLVSFGLAAIPYWFLAWHLPSVIGKERAADAAFEEATRLARLAPKALLQAASSQVRKMDKLRDQLPDDIAQHVGDLIKHARTVIAGVTKQPAQLSTMLRFFTYYLPATLDLVTNRIALRDTADDDMLAEMDHALLRLDEVYTGFTAQLIQPELIAVDIDLKLLDEAMDSDVAVSSKDKV